MSTQELVQAVKDHAVAHYEVDLGLTAHMTGMSNHRTNQQDTTTTAQRLATASPEGIDTELAVLVGCTARAAGHLERAQA